MILKNLKRVFKKPDENKEKELKAKIDEIELEKGDLPAMVFSAYLVFIPIAVLVLGIIALVAFFFVR